MSHAAEMYHAGAMIRPMWILLRDDDNAIEGAEIDGGTKDGGLRERRITTLDGENRTDGNAGME